MAAEFDEMRPAGKASAAVPAPGASGRAGPRGSFTPGVAVEIASGTGLLTP